MKKTPKIRTYSELLSYPTYEERLKYLRLVGMVGRDTFGFDRIFNQQFYNTSNEWKSIRNFIIVRDGACDLGIPSLCLDYDEEFKKKYDVKPRIYIHHMNPISLDDIRYATDYLLNPEYLICTSLATHNAIHYGTDVPVRDPIVRRPNDMAPWKKGT